MAMGHYFQEAVALGDSIAGESAPLQKFNSVSAKVDGVEHSPSGGFDCNICLDFVHDPVVTLCGHLYCWPCIYKWIHYQSLSAENPDHQEPQCPVCKAVVSQETLVPLYGRGSSTKPSDSKAPHLGLVIPRRPSTPRCGTHNLATTPLSTSMRSAQQLHPQSYQQQQQPYNYHPSIYDSTPMLSLSGTTTTNPIIGVFGEMVYARLFGNPETTLYTYPNSYHLTGNSSPRFRRHLMEADKSLGRLCFFLFCCMVLCLLLF